MSGDVEMSRRIREYAERCAAKAPPLSSEQKDRLAVLLRPEATTPPARIPPAGGEALAEMMGRA